MGRTIEPVIKPLGFNWRIGIGLITSLAARETIIGTLGTIYGMDPNSQKMDLQKSCTPISHPGRGGAADLLRFCHAVHLHHCCGASRDRGLEMADFQFAYMGVLAYAGAFLAFHIIG